MDRFEHKITAHYFSGFIEEALYSLLRAHSTIEQNKEKHETLESSFKDDETVLIGILLRHAFLATSSALESAANGLIHSLALHSKTCFEDLEKLTTLTKFEVFALSNGKNLNRSSDKYEKIKKWISCRNSFVHPKPSRVGVGTYSDDRDIVLETKKIGNRDYPLAFEFIDREHAIWIVEDTLAFVAEVVFDLCGLSTKEGSRLVGAGTTSKCEDMYRAKKLFGFDLRSLGID